MNSYEKFYRERLYPFQDGVLNLVKRSNIPCYLTGGTALSRGYFNHRYSDDLDLFMNRQKAFSTHVQTLFRLLEEGQAEALFEIDYNRLQRYEDHTQLFLVRTVDGEKLSLKLDIVNDVASHYGKLKSDAILGFVDSWQNILSNKLTSIFRYEAKDVVDIRTIARHRRFNWMKIVQEAKTKEAGIDPVILFDILKSFPVDELLTIKWVSPVDSKAFREDLDRIAEEILRGTDNSIAST